MKSLLQRISWRISSWLTAPLLLHAAGERLFHMAGRGQRPTRRPIGEYRRVLVVRTDEIGDLVLFSPFLRELRANLPDAWITLVVKSSVVDLVRSCPHVNEVLPYDWEVSPYWGPVQLFFRSFRLAKADLWRRRFDLAIMPRWNTDYYGASQLAYLSGAERRVAYSEHVAPRKADANRGYDRLFTEVLTERGARHEVDRNLDFLRHLGGVVRDDTLETWTRPEDAAGVQTLLELEQVSGNERLVALGVSARHEKKVWPAANYLELARWLHTERHARILIVGGQADARIGETLRSELGSAVVNLAGRTGLAELAALMKRVDLFIGNDTGPKHVAAAAGVPVIEISWHPRSGNQNDPFSPAAFAPWKTPSVVLQPDRALPPCVDTCSARSAHCITLVTVESVKQAATVLLNDGVARREA